MKFITNNLVAITRQIKGLLLFSQVTAKLQKKKKSGSAVTVGRTDMTACDSRILWCAEAGAGISDMEMQCSEGRQKRKAGSPGSKMWV